MRGVTLSPNALVAAFIYYALPCYASALYAKKKSVYIRRTNVCTRAHLNVK
jgi:hypothetical protein